MSFLPTDRVMLQALRASKIRGVQLAIVVDNKDGEGNPGYRVKLKFPWLNEQESTFWARIAVPMAGPGRGTYVLPEIDDQVLVVFEHGDINRPIVVGSLWSRKQEPVEVHQSGKNNTKLIKSRAGHRIIFDDKEGAEKIILVDKTGKNKIIIDSASKLVKIESDGDIEIKAKTNAILHANALKIGTSQGVTGKAASLLTHSQGSFSVKATTSITIGGGTTTINVTNAAATRVSGSGSGELGGIADQKPAGNKASGGTSGANGAGQAAGAARPPASTGAAKSPAAAKPKSPDDLMDPRDIFAFIAISLVDKTTGDPIPHRRFRMRSGPDGTITGQLDDRGKTRQDTLLADEMDVECPFVAAAPETVHIVKQGEHTSGIAEANGFDDYKVVWEAVANKSLAAKRKHPHILLLGDELVIPERTSTPQKLATGQEHVITLERSPLRLEVVLQDSFKHPIASTDVVFDGTHVTTDGDGLFTIDLDKQARGGTLSLPSRDLQLLIGHLDPIDTDTDTGWRARLVNLGFMWDDDGGPEEDRVAIEDFQADQKLKVTGVMDDATRAKLEKAHGC
jgi:phage baseplate assembly protein gpV